MLKTEQNTPAIRAEIEAVAQLCIGKYHGRLAAIFEHGQWWIVSSNGAQWSVNDATGPGSTDGFDFEMVTTPRD